MMPRSAWPCSHLTSCATFAGRGAAQGRDKGPAQHMKSASSRLGVSFDCACSNGDFFATRSSSSRGEMEGDRHREAGFLPGIVRHHERPERRAARTVGPCTLIGQP